MSCEIEKDTAINENDSGTVPAAIREKVSADAGDELRWHVDEDGSLSVELVKQQYGASSGVKPADIGGSTDVADNHDLFAGEY